VYYGFLSLVKIGTASARPPGRLSGGSLSGWFSSNVVHYPADSPEMAQQRVCPTSRAKRTMDWDTGATLGIVSGSLVMLGIMVWLWR
jgi:hypothetical protein